MNPKAAPRLRRPAWAAGVTVVGLACSVLGAPGGLSQPTQPGSTITPLPTSAPVTPTPQPQTPTLLPPIITAGDIGGLTVALTFGEGIVRAVALSPDGTILAAAEGNPEASIGTIRLYDPATGNLVGTLEGHESGVWGLAFSPDGRYLASAGRDHTARVWDWHMGSLVKTLDFPNEVVSIAFSPDSLTLAVGGVDELPGTPLQDAAIWTYSVDTWDPQDQLAEYWNISDIAFTPDGARIAGGGTSRNLRVWRTRDGSEERILYHAGQVGSIAISPDGLTLASALCESSEAGRCVRGAVWLWDLGAGTRRESLTDFAGAVVDVAYSPDGTMLFVATAGELRAYATAGFELLLATAPPPGPFELDIADLAVSNDGRFLATGGSGRIDVWRVAK